MRKNARVRYILRIYFDIYTHRHRTRGITLHVFLGCLSKPNRYIVLRSATGSLLAAVWLIG